MSRDGTDTVRQGVVVAIADHTLSMIDARTGNSFDIRQSAPGGVQAMEGDYWACTCDDGYWSLDYCIIPRQTSNAPQTSFRAMLDMLRRRGLIDPSFPDAVRPEAPHLAYIGECRLFAYVPDIYFWIPTDGRAVNRIKYRELAMVLDPNGTSATFNVPATGGGIGSVLCYICAR